MLSDVRDVQEKSGWVGRQLRSDVTYISTSHYGRFSSFTRESRPVPLRIRNDNRGNTEFDELWLLVREPGSAGISEIRYFLDEDKGHLMRQSRMIWARDSVDPMLWDMGEASSWAVEARNKEGQWQQDWQMQASSGQGSMIWPRALRIRLQNEMGEREWLLPVEYGIDL
jgi:hypothetical protein